MIHVLQHVCYCSIRGICHIGEWNWIPLPNLDKPCRIVIFRGEGEWARRVEKNEGKWFTLFLGAKEIPDFNKITTFVSNLLNLTKQKNTPPPKTPTHTPPRISLIYIMKLYKCIRDFFNMYKSIFSQVPMNSIGHDIIVSIPLNILERILQCKNWVQKKLLCSL